MLARTEYPITPNSIYAAHHAMLRSRGMPPVDVMKMARHANLSTTMKYFRPRTSTQKWGITYEKVVNRLSIRVSFKSVI